MMDFTIYSKNGILEIEDLKNIFISEDENGIYIAYTNSEGSHSSYLLSKDDFERKVLKLW